MSDIAKALAAYQAGELTGALWALGGPQQVDGAAEAEERTEAQAQAGWPAQGAVADWVHLAQCRIRRELGEDVVAVVPVELALGTALRLLEQEQRIDEALQTIEATEDGLQPA